MNSKNYIKFLGFLLGMFLFLATNHADQINAQLCIPDVGVCSIGQQVNGGCCGNGLRYRCFCNELAAPACPGQGSWSCQCTVNDSSCSTDQVGPIPIVTPTPDYQAQCNWTDNRPYCAGDGTFCGNPQQNSSGNLYCPGNPEWYFCCPGLWTNAQGICACPECQESNPNPAVIVSPSNNQVVYSNRVDLVYILETGWGRSCPSNNNSHKVFVSQGCSGVFADLGPISELDNLTPNTEYCWFVRKSNGNRSVNTSTFRFITGDVVPIDINLTSIDTCGFGWAGLLGEPKVANPLSWSLSGPIPNGLQLQYVSFAMIRSADESSNIVSKNVAFAKATEINNTNSVAIDLYPNQLRLYSSSTNFITSNNFTNTASPFGNYNLKNVSFNNAGNSYSINFSIEFLENFKSSAYKLYIMAVYTDLFGNTVSSNSFSGTSQLSMWNKNQNFGDGVWGVDTIKPFVEASINRTGASNQFITFDPQTFVKSSDLQSGLNPAHQYVSVRSFLQNGNWRQNGVNFNITNQIHPTYSTFPIQRNPSSFDPINPSVSFEILDQDLNYQARIGTLDRACNFGYRDISIPSGDSSWITTLEGNSFSRRGFFNVFVPDTAINFNYSPINFNQNASFSSYGNFSGGPASFQRSSFIGYNIGNYSLTGDENSFFDQIKTRILKRNEIRDITLSISANSEVKSVNLDSIGLVRGNQFLLRVAGSGFADISFPFGDIQTLGNKYVVGDWDGDGIDTPGLYTNDGRFLLINQNQNTSDVISITFGNSNWLPVVGDWNGNGTDTIGLYDPSTSTFYLRNSNSTGFADLTFTFLNSTQGSFVPIAGDWNGNGTSTIGLYDQNTSTFYLRNSNASGTPDLTYTFGSAGVSYKVATGDWAGQGFDNVAIWNPNNGIALLKNFHDNSQVYSQIVYGNEAEDLNSIFVAGTWIDNQNLNVGDPISILRLQNPEQIPFINLSDLLPEPQNGWIIGSISQPVNLNGNFRCDVKSIIFLESELNLYSYNFTNLDDNSLCLFISKEDITLNSPISNVIPASTDVFYNRISGFFISDKNINVILEEPQSAILSNILDARGLFLNGSLVARSNINFRGRLDNVPNINPQKPAFVIQYDPRFRNLIKEVAGFRTFSIREE